MAEDQATSTTPQENNTAIAPDQGDGAQIIECPTCHNQRRAFLIVNGKCDSCRTRGEPARVVPELGWPEVRARRDRLIFTTDSSQLADRTEEVKSKYLPLRERLRNVTEKPDPITAWYELDTIEAEMAK